MIAGRFCRNASFISKLRLDTLQRTGGAVGAEMGGMGRELKFAVELTGGAGSTGAVGGTTVRYGGGAGSTGAVGGTTVRYGGGCAAAGFVSPGTLVP